MEILLIQSSLNENSKTAVVLSEVEQVLQERGVTTKMLDLRNIDMEFCDGRELEQYNEQLQDAYQDIVNANAIIIGAPVYCYSISGVLKNFIDITSAAFDDKYIGIIENSGGVRSYLATSHLSHILFYESDVKTVPPVVHTYSKDFMDGHEISNEKIHTKIQSMVDNLLQALK